MREAMASELRGINIGGEGRKAEIDGAYFGALVPPGTVQLVAFSSTGSQLQTLTLPGPDAS